MSEPPSNDSYDVRLAKLIADRSTPLDSVMDQLARLQEEVVGTDLPDDESETKRRLLQELAVLKLTAAKQRCCSAELALELLEACESLGFRSEEERVNAVAIFARACLQDCRLDLEAGRLARVLKLTTGEYRALEMLAAELDELRRNP